MIMARNEDGTYSQVGFVKDNAGIDTEYIYDKDGDIVFEKGFTRETSGTVPLTINGIGKDLKSWSITGNTVQNGTPTPENPVEVQSVGDYDSDTGLYKIPVVTRGKNLFDYNAEHTDNIQTKIYTISNLDINKYYTCSTSFEKIPGVTTASLYFAGKNSLTNGVWKNTPRTFKPDANGQIAVYVRHITSEGAPEIFDKVISGEITIMVEEDSTATPYEPYHEPITTPIYLPTPLYSGEVLRSDGSREVKFHKLVLTGSEDCCLQSINSYGIANFYIKVDTTFKPGIKHFCTHFSIQTTLIAQTTKEGLLFTNNDTIYIRVKQELASTVYSLK